jgi:hypothetical protein
LIVVAFLFPLAVYCLILGLVNRRRHPLMVSAAWDFVGILFAASGFLVLAGPVLLTGFSDRWRLFWLVGQARGLDVGGTEDAWHVLAVAYFVVVVGVSAYVLWRRQSQTAVYNVNTAVFDEVLAGALDATGLTWSRAGNRYFIRGGVKGRPMADDSSGEPLPSGKGRGAYPASVEEIEQSAYLEVDPAPSLCHVTLRWEAEDEGLRKQVEAELARALAEVRTRDNPVGGWLLTAGSALLAAAVMVFAVVVVYRLFFER